MNTNPSADNKNPNENKKNNSNFTNRKNNKKRQYSNATAEVKPGNNNNVQQTQTDKNSFPTVPTVPAVKPNQIKTISKNKYNRNDRNFKNENKNPVAASSPKENKTNPNEDIHVNIDAAAENASQEFQSDDDVDINGANHLKPVEPVETGPTAEIVGIRYKPVGKIYFFAPNDVQYSLNDKVIVETTRGLELGYIVIPNKNISLSKITQPLKPVLRKASDEDAERAEKNKKAAKDTIKIANDRIKFHNLDSMKMKLIEAEYTFDNSKLIYFFTADGRVDFRELVKDLAAIFKTRIEMRQIGIRDQTKILGGLSICGRPFCCNSFLQDLAQVTIKMAKEQNMQINSAKISGACGKLMCCLKYEHEAYEHLSKETPKPNSVVETPTGDTGVVVEANLLTGMCKVRITQKQNGEIDNILKSISKKNLKIIGFMKNEQEHLYNDNDNDNDADSDVADDPEDIKGLEQDI